MGGNAGFFGGFAFFVLSIAGYVYLALALSTLSKKTGRGTAWWAWIPILNVLLLLQVAGKPLWYIILLFIPVVNIIIMVIVWMATAESVNKPSWLGILVLVPIANIILPGYLAWG